MIPDTESNRTLVASMGRLRETISFPVPQSQSNAIVVSGRSSPIRYTEALGCVSYQPRSFSLTFSMLGPGEKYDQMVAEMASHYTSQLIEVSTSEEPELYTIGILEISPEYNPLPGKSQLVISREDADSYRYHNDGTIINLASPGMLVIESDFMPVIPVIITSTRTALSWTIGSDSFKKSLSAGTRTLPELELQAGINTVAVQRTGTIVFRFRKGRL